ncbi:SsrA-binding protein [candidate division LCP-89 bacterium B3_LCP]|uniref:SsrA-binding protein n=1 Tax=candidate division LCP-89 bacterium B3_LCP TaxID=2012998 RepID=A0A532UZ49_UNCL8|nr:MAG: SsrA-binding protein [candidate division LCP-89 bacterium B3_LCP]
MTEKRQIAGNRKARRDYHILDKYEAGICLLGTEVKSLRMGSANLKDSYAAVRNGEVFLHNVHIGPYDKGNIANHEPMRVRKLLLQKRQINKLQSATQDKGLTLIPLSLYWKGNIAKVELATARGKRQYDKRDAITKREQARELDRVMKDHLKYNR